MAYATQADIEALYGRDTLTQAADRLGDGTIDADAVTKALDDAASEIDSYVAAKYDIPLASTPPRLVKLNADIALYHLAQDGAAYTDEQRQRYDDALDWLKMLAKGQVSLGLPDPPASLGGGPQVSSATRLFTRSKLSGLL